MDCGVSPRSRCRRSRALAEVLTQRKETDCELRREERFKDLQSSSPCGRVGSIESGENGSCKVDGRVAEVAGNAPQY